MASPATFHHDHTGAGAWTSSTGTTRWYDFVALPRTLLPVVEHAGVDRTFRLDVNLRLDHVLTQVVVQLQTDCHSGMAKPSKLSLPTRASLQLPEVREAIQLDVHLMPPTSPHGSIDKND